MKCSILTRISIEKLKQVMSTPTSLLRYLSQKIRRKHLKSQRRWVNWSARASICRPSSVITGLMLLAFSPAAQAEVNPNQAILAIVGEAEDQGLIGMTAVGEAIRNRGHLKGVYGLKSPRLKKAPKWVFSMARKAWEKSSESNLVKGAQFWESTDFKTPYWAKGMTEVAHIGKHKFYREVKP